MKRFLLAFLCFTSAWNAFAQGNWGILTATITLDKPKGTHEFMLNYRVRLRGIHRDVECPAYFSH